MLKLDSEIQALIDTSREGFATRLWQKYRPPPDVEDWLCGLTAVAEDFPFSLCVTDTLLPGNPLVYINEKFTEMTGYSQQDALGRNCRFLQGPHSENGAIEAIKISIQEAKISAVRITNYRKSGERFLNLLALRPIKDSDGELRFCVGVHIELDESLDCEKSLKLLAIVMDALPTSIELADPVEREKKRKAASLAPPKPSFMGGGVAKTGAKMNSLFSSIKPLTAVNPDTISAGEEQDKEKEVTAADGKADAPAESAPRAPSSFDLVRAAVFPKVGEICHAENDLRAAESLAIRDMTRLFWLAATPQNLATLLAESTIKDAFQTFVNTRSSEAASVFEHLTEHMDEGISEEVLGYLTVMREHFWSLFLETKEASRVIYALQEQESELISGTRGTWLEKLRIATEFFPFALIVVDMHAPGARIVAANAAFENLTGHSREWAIGRNCRFLQGDKTEREAVEKMVRKLRSGYPSQVELTNYKQDGTPFRNLLSLQPVHDSDGVYRYCIGMLADTAHLNETTKKELMQMRRLLPRRFDSRQQPLASKQAGRRPEAPPNMLLRFHRLALLQDLRSCTTLILDNADAVEALTQHLSNGVDGTEHLDLYMRIKKFLALPQGAQRERVFKEFADIIDLNNGGGRKGAAMAKEAIAEVTQLGEQALQSISANIPSFICSDDVDDGMVKRLMPDDGSSGGGGDIGAQKLLWEHHDVLPDAANWLYGLVRCVDDNVVSITISDLRGAGNPLIYANKAFYRSVGYERTDVLGRNCRFLQGAETPADTISPLVQAIRSGSGCNVRVLNFKRSGAAFEHAVTLRIISDSNGVGRFCIGVQYDLTAAQSATGSEETSATLSQLEAMVDAIVQLVPTRFDATVELDALEEQGGMVFSCQSVVVDKVGKGAEPSEPCAGEDATSATVDDVPALLWHEYDAFTKVMWLRHANPEFVRSILLHPPTGKYWKRFLEAKERPMMYSLDFCLAVSKHDELEGDERRKHAFEMAAKFLRETGISDPEDLDERIKEESDNAMRRLAEEEFAPFIASRMCTKLLHELRNAKTRILTCFLYPDSSRLPKDLTKEQKCLESLKLALSGFSLPVMLCDRSIPGLPIVGLSDGVSKLTGYTAADLIGQSCRTLQGPKTEVDAVTSLSGAIRSGSRNKTTITNYTKLGSPFANLLALGESLLLTPDGKTVLNAAVLHENPRPMKEKRVHRAGDALLDVLASCGCPKSCELHYDFPGGVSKQELDVGWRWVMDAVQTMKKMLRIEVLRELFLKSALLSPNRHAEVAAEEGRGIQDVHLMLHSKNTLRDYTQYLTTACSFWEALENLKHSAGWEYRNNLLALNKKFIVPERGRRKRAWLWVVLRQCVFDRMAENELQLVEAEDIDFGIDVDMELDEGNLAPPEAAQPADDGNKGDAETGSASTAVANADVVLRDAAMLQHVLLRTFAPEVIPMFINSPEYTEVRAELLTADNPPAVYSVLDVELESLKDTFPQTSEEWLGLVIAAFKYLPQAVIICDASLPGLPIVSVSVGFEALTGFKSSFAVGKNCSFLQGPDTEVSAVQELREAIRAQEPCHVSLLNYKSNGSTFLNFLSITPIFDEDSLCHYYVGTLTEVAERFSGIKPHLRNADRLHKLLPKFLRMKSRPDARKRMEAIVKTPRQTDGGGLASSSSQASLPSVRTNRD